MVLYHAISSYQILESFIHRNLYHKKEKAILILPDFIVNKFPQYNEIQEIGLFDEVYLFQYRKIPNEHKHLYQNIETIYNSIIKYDIHEFNEIYVAAGHFYFSLYLIKNKIKFNYFEDGCGILSRPEISFDLVNSNTPFQAEWARDNGMFDGKNPLVKKRICNISAQTRPIQGEDLIDFNVALELRNIDEIVLEKILRFFRVPKEITILENSMLVMTQQLSNLKKITFEEQILLYQLTIDYYVENYNIVFKPHPDDVTYYKRVFPDATVIKGNFPAELIPFISNDIEINGALVQYSSALDGVKKCFKTNIFCGYGIEKFYKQIHKYYYSLKIVEKINKDSSYEIYSINLFEKQVQNLINYSNFDKNILNCNKVNYIDGIDDLNSSNKKIIIYADKVNEEIIDENLIKRLLFKCNENDVIILLNNEKKYIFYEINSPDVFNYLNPLTIKKKQVNDEIYSNLNDETIFIYTKNEGVRMDMGKIEVSKKCKYTGIETSLEILDDIKIENAILKAKLEATEERLRYYVNLVNSKRE